MSFAWWLCWLSVTRLVERENEAPSPETIDQSKVHTNRLGKTPSLHDIFLNRTKDKLILF